MKQFFIAAIGLLFFTFNTSNILHAQAWAWGRGGTGPLSLGYAVATDSAGNLFVGGAVSGSGTEYFGSLALSLTASAPTGIVYAHAAWVKYSSAGTALWAGGTQNGAATLINLTTDRNGNLIVYGFFTTPSLIIGGITLLNPMGSATATGYGKYFLAKYDPAGTLLWAIADGNYYSYTYLITPAATPNGPKSVTTDAAGNIYITGSFPKATATIGTTTLTNIDPSGATTDIFVAKYDPSGTVVWAKSMGGSGTDYGFGITIPPSGDIYICGLFFSDTFNIGSSLLTNPYGPIPVARCGAYIARLSAAGTPMWGMSGIGPHGAYGISLDHDEAGNIYMAGSFGDTTITFGTTTVTRAYLPDYWAAGYDAFFMLKIMPDNTVSWSKTISTRGNNVLGYSVSVGCNKVWVCGRYTDTADIDGYKLAPVPTSVWTVGEPQLWIAAYNFSGTNTNRDALNASLGGSDNHSNIACDRNGNLFLGTTYDNSVTVGPDVLFASGYHILLAKYGNLGPDTIYARTDTTLCGAGLILNAPPGYDSYLWDNGSASVTRPIGTTGNYWTICNSHTTCSNELLIDSFHVSIGVPDTTTHTTDTTFCRSLAGVTLYAGTDYTAYLWNTGDTARTLTTNASGIYIVTALTGCKMQTDTFVIVVNNNPVAAIQQHSGACGSVTLTALPLQGVTYLWSTGDRLNSLYISGSANYKVTVTDTNGCMATDSIDAIVNIQHYSFLTGVTPSQTIAYGSTIQLNAYNGTRYMWLPNDGSLSNPNINNPVATPLVPTTYTVISFDQNGCRDSASLTIDLSYDDIYIPSAFTPNGDGLNDFFRVVNLSYNKLESVTIVNRWGEVVYNSEDGSNKGWDGSYKGVPQDLGVFFYTLQIMRPNGEHKMYNGDITLIK